MACVLSFADPKHTIKCALANTYPRQLLRKAGMPKRDRIKDNVSYVSRNSRISRFPGFPGFSRVFPGFFPDSWI